MRATKIAAEERARRAIRPTCPQIDSAAEYFESYVEYTGVDGLIKVDDVLHQFSIFREKEQKAREALREAIEDAYERVIELEGGQE